MTEPDRRRLPLDVQTRTSDRRVEPAHQLESERVAPAPIQPIRPPKGSPNVVIVLIDDMGFGASTPYGGPCQMPTAERLAAEGLRYSRFHVTSLCSPTRQALLTGRNHHSVGMGVTTEMSTPEPGYTGYRPASAATIAQILGGNGYATAAFGKWHQTPPVEVNPAGPFTRWPTGEGFDTFYGFMGAEMNHWYPQLFEGTTPVEPDRMPEEGYHLSEDLADRAIEWVTAQQAIVPDRPFFTYLALGATHAPFHVKPSWQERYAGAFDAGWDVQREEILARQKELGIVPQAAELSPWAEGVPHWDDLDETEKRVAARFMEAYAGFAEHADVQVGRFVTALEELGVLDDTIVLYLLGDNGASGEGGPRGTFREHLVGHGFEDDTDYMHERLDQLGDATTYPIYPVGWALAMNTPYQWTKQVASHFGGTRDGMIVRWGNGIEARGEIRHQWHHVIDILPTVLEAVGLPHPTSVGGVDQQPVEGVSMRYSFADPEAPDQRTTQYFEMVGNRGIYHRGWTASTRHGVPWEMVGHHRPFEEDVWELYDTETDWSQARDLAAEQPDRVEELRQLFVMEAGRHQVFPLDDRVTERENPSVAGRIDLHRGRTTITFGPATRRLNEEAAPNVKNRSHVITADLQVGGANSDGVIVAQGGRFGGWALYVVQGVPHYAYNNFGRDLTVIKGEGQISPGRHELVVDFVYDGGPPGSGAEVALRLDGEEVGRGRLASTTAFYFSFDETFNVGVDPGTPVCDDYRPVRNRFEGRIFTVRFDLGEQDEIGSPEQHHQARMTHQ